jgi:hypothetical protein
VIVDVTLLLINWTLVSLTEVGWRTGERTVRISGSDGSRRRRLKRQQSEDRSFQFFPLNGKRRCGSRIADFSMDVNGEESREDIAGGERGLSTGWRKSK